MMTISISTKKGGGAVVSVRDYKTGRRVIDAITNFVGICMYVINGCFGDGGCFVSAS